MKDSLRKAFLFMACGIFLYIIVTKETQPRNPSKRISKSGPITYQQIYNNATELKKWDNFTVEDRILNKLCYIDLNIKKWAPDKEVKFCNPSGAEGMLSDNNWETNFQDILFNTLFKLVPHAAFIDIGGLLGVYTLSAATLGRQVFTFEPFWTFDYIKTSVVKNNLKDRVSLYK
ncbi:uncharacterized protein LOC142356230, partial [Convolutriloba macropyga]|uniref:uncharacterized protein LOC142356230 n=1 Tax=Convolutriloba macropyga TaxID=536237 RepID=UPI003F51CEF6